jgi:hypothetical protein
MTYQPIHDKKTDSRKTPKWIMKMFEDFFDPCPYNPNYTIDGLLLDWKDKTYCNPPYTETTKWVVKAIEENKKNKYIVLLLRGDLTTNYSRMLIENKAKFFYCSALVNFEDDMGNKLHSPFPSIIWVLENKAELESEGKK